MVVARIFEMDPRALEYGSVIHAWLEQVNWLDDGLPTDDEFRQIAGRVSPRLTAEQAACSQLIADLRNNLAQPTIAELLHRAYYDRPSRLGLADPSVVSWKVGEIALEVLPERKFAICDAGQILTGSIDRLILIRQGGKLIAADIVDFKTDTLAPKDSQALAAKVEFYRPQIEAYRRAVARLYRLEQRRIAARLAFLSTGNVVAV